MSRSIRAVRAKIRGSSRGRAVRVEDLYDDGDDAGPSGYRPKTRSSSRARVARFADDYDDGDGAGASGVRPRTRASKRAKTPRFVLDSDSSDDGDGPPGVNPPPQPRTVRSEAEIGGSDWERQSDDSLDDRTYHPPRAPVNLPGRGGIGESETSEESESEPEDMAYVRVHDSTLDSVQDSDLPLQFRIARLAQVNGPGTDHFTWTYSQDAYVRRNAFSGEYLLYSCCAMH